MRNLRIGVTALFTASLLACGGGSGSSSKGQSSAGGAGDAGAAGSAGATPTTGGKSSSGGGSATSGGTVATGGTGAAGGPSTAKPIAVADLCPIFTADLCTYLIQCNGARYRDLEHCKQELDCFGMKELLDSDAKGRVTYDPSQVGACHERFISSPCTFGSFLFTPDIFEVLSFCPGTIAPNQTEGTPCVSDGECKDNLYCYKGANYQCPGTCKKRSQLGESCAGSARCEASLSCGTGSVCVEKQKAGDACSTYCNYSVVCAGTEPCPGNIWCDISSGTCQSGRLLGEACGNYVSGSSSYTADCAINLWCNASGTATGTCQKLSPEGGACKSSEPSCAKGFHCAGAIEYGTSAKLGVCVGPGPIGSTCSSDGECSTNLICNAGLCAAPSLASGACAGSSDCATGLTCVGNACVQARYPGDSCNSTDLVCVHSRCVSGTCQYHAGAGEPCTLDGDCATSHCVSGVCYDDSVCSLPL